jgi:hypothetical protein
MTFKLSQDQISFLKRVLVKNGTFAKNKEWRHLAPLKQHRLIIENEDGMILLTKKGEDFLKLILIPSQD